MRPPSAKGTMPTSQVALSRGGTGARPDGKHGCVTFNTHCCRYRAWRAACLRRPLRLRWYFRPAAFWRSRLALAAHSAEQYWQRPSHRRHRRNSPPHRGHRRSNRSTGRQRPRDWTSSATHAIQDLVGASCLEWGHLRGLGAANSGPSVYLRYYHPRSTPPRMATSRNCLRSPAYDQIARPRFSGIVSSRDDERSFGVAHIRLPTAPERRWVDDRGVLRLPLDERT
jgi:hypothetical protein